MNSPARPATVTIPVEGKIGGDHDRQLDGGRVSEEGGRHSFPSVSPPLLPDSSTGIRLRRHAFPNESGGQAQCPSGSSLEDASSGSLGVGHIATNVQLDSEQIAVGSASDRPIREQHEPPSSPTHVTLSGPRNRGNRRARGTVAKRRAVHLSSDLRRSTIVTASEAEDGRASPPNSPVQSARQVDAFVAGTSASSDVEDPGIAEHVDAASLGVLPSGNGSDEPASVDHRSERLKNLGFSEAVIQRLEKARATSTSKQYKSKWDLFVGWATNSGRNPLSASLPLLAEFLVYLFRERRVSLQTIKNYRSAIAFYWRSTSGFKVPEKDRVLADLFRGFARERPSVRKHTVDWDLSLVLKFLSSGRFRDWSTLSDKDLTQKLVFLLALATGKRRSELHALSTRIEWVNGEHSAVILHPDPAFVSKTHISSRGLGALTAITITSLDSVVSQDDDDARLQCPVRTLSHYLERTKQYRSTNQKRLIISHQRGLEKDISMQTVSAYIKDLIISAHSRTRPWLGQ